MHVDLRLVIERVFRLGKNSNTDGRAALRQLLDQALADRRRRPVIAFTDQDQQGRAELQPDVTRAVRIERNAGLEAQVRVLAGLDERCEFRE